MRERLIKFGRHLLMVVVGIVGVGWLLLWLVDVPARWPDHGRNELSATLTAEQLEDLDCLIGEIQADPALFRTSTDFGVSYPGRLMIEGWLRSTTIESQEGTRLTMRAELRRRVQIETSCDLTGLLPPKIDE